jgi:hypothetical protein
MKRIGEKIDNCEDDRESKLKPEKEGERRLITVRTTGSFQN